MAFRGHFDYSLDAKNRLNVPPKFRAAFSDGVVLARGLEPCVWLWPPAAFDRFTDQVLGSLNPVSAERRKLTRYVAGHSFDAELDAAGRVGIPAKLMEHASLSKDVVVAGARDRIEVWDREQWRSHDAELTNEIPDITASLGHPG